MNCDTVHSLHSISSKDITDMADIESVLLNLLQTVADEQKYDKSDIKVESINTGGANYTSKLFNLGLTAPGKDHLNLFAKVANIEDSLRDHMNAGWMYSTEIYVYTKLVPIFKEFLVTYKIPMENQHVFPKFYGCNTEVGKETVVLENLVSEGYSSFDRFEALNWEQVSACMEELANFHALSFIYEKDYPEEFRETLKYLKYRKFEMSDETAKQQFRSMVMKGISVLDKEDQTKLSNFLETVGEKLVEYNNPLKKAVLIHGDYRPSNLLFKMKNGKMSLVTVDYQTVHTGCIANDLVYFFSLATDEEFRKTHFTQMIDHYYQHLSATLKYFEINIEEAYPRSVFDAELKEMLPFSLVVGLIVLPMICVDPDNAPKVSGDGADISQFALEPNKLFAKRFRGLVRDYFKWGAI